MNFARRIARLPRAAARRLVNCALVADLRSEARAQKFHRWNERPVEFAFLFRHLARLYPRDVLDVGTGTTAVPNLLRYCGCVVTAVDNVRDYWTAGMINRHWHVEDDSITSSRLPGASFDLISCISVLEHVADDRAAMREMCRLLRPGGHLVLTGPYTEREYVEDVYKTPSVRAEFIGMTSICRSYSRASLDAWLADSPWEEVDAEYWITFTGRYMAEGDWVFPTQPSSRDGHHNLACRLLRKSA